MSILQVTKPESNPHFLVGRLAKLVSSSVREGIEGLRCCPEAGPCLVGTCTHRRVSQVLISHPGHSVKALNRRATAYENLSRDEEALRDFTATTIMERFQNAAAAESVERVLKKISTKKAEDIMKAREPKLPSYTFVSSYLGAFRARKFRERFNLFQITELFTRKQNLN